jgi:CheY-like chemotaxis protein
VLVRDGLTVILDAAPDIAMVSEAANGVEAVEAAVALHPDVVLMDVRMPGMDGITATTAICARTAARVLMLTTYDLDEHVYDAVAGRGQRLPPEEHARPGPGRSGPRCAGGWLWNFFLHLDSLPAAFAERVRE